MFGMKKSVDFLAIGDITTDAFIRIKEASVHCGLNKDECEICMKFAEKIPYEFVEVIKGVGNSPNASVSAARLGLESGIVTNIGDDQNGRECIEALEKSGVNTQYVLKHNGTLTNYHYVLWYEDERTILVKHEHYDYHLPKFNPPPKWIYLSSVGGGTEEYHDEIAKYLNEHSYVRLAFQPGTFQMRLGYERLKEIYKRTEVFVCNVGEAKQILKKEGEIKELLRGVRELGPKIVLITDGPRGAYAFDGTDCWFMPPYPDPQPPYERTGAGDAFASTFAAALALGKSVKEALMWAPINSMSVVQYTGAQKGLLTREHLEDFLKKAPADYQPKKIN